MNAKAESMSKKEKKPQPPLSGLAIVASLWVWGAILFFAPNYLNISGGWKVPFNIFGTIILTISFGGALIELSKQWKSEALSYWGAGLVFLVPSIALFILVHISTVNSAWIVISKIGALLLLAIGAPIIFMGIPHLFWRDEQATKLEMLNEELSEKEIIEKKAAKKEAKFSTLASIIIALLSLTTAIVKLLFEVLQ